jgi:hypothetical protein
VTQGPFLPFQLGRGMSAIGGVNGLSKVDARRPFVTRSGPRCGCQFALQHGGRSAAIPCRTPVAVIPRRRHIALQQRKPGSGCSALSGINDKHVIFGWSEACVATQPSDPLLLDTGELLGCDSDRVLYLVARRRRSSHQGDSFLCELRAEQRRGRTLHGHSRADSPHRLADLWQTCKVGMSAKGLAPGG